MDWIAISFSRGSTSSNLCLLHWQVDSLPLSHQESPYILYVPARKVTYYYHYFHWFLQHKAVRDPPGILGSGWVPTLLPGSFSGRGSCVLGAPLRGNVAAGSPRGFTVLCCSPWGVGYTSDLLSYGIVFCQFVCYWRLSDWGPKAFFLLEIEFGTWGYLGTCCSLQKAICPQVLLDLLWWVSLIHTSALFCGVGALQGEWSSGWGLDEPPLPMEVLL